MKNKISGWKEIFSFTFSQSIKTKSIKITTIILCLIAICSMPIMSMVKGKDTEKKKTSIKKVLVLDATELNLYNNINVLKETDLYKSNEKKIYTDITYDVAKIEAKDPNASLKDIYKFDKKANEVYMVLTYVKDQIGIQLLYSDKTSVKENDVNDYSAFVEEHFNKVLANNQNISEEQKKIATSKLSVKYYDKDEAAAIDKKADKKDTYAGSKNNIIYATLLIIMFVLSFGGERVAVSIITEKSSKVMEFLLTSVKPMAIVIGKVLASLLILFIQMLLIVGSFGISILITSYMNSDGEKTFVLPKYISRILNMHNFSGATPLLIIIAVLIFVAGFLFYGLIAGLAGASVSRIDEMSEGIKIYTILLIIGAYIAIFFVTQKGYIDNSAFKYFVELCPVTSIFVTPSAIITGYVSVTEALGSLAIMLLFVVLLTKFVSNVYESMVYYNGSPLKIKGIINISKENRKKAK